MRQELERLLKQTMNDVKERLAGCSREECAEFFGLMADLAYRVQESLMAADDMEMQNYEDD
jgi:hypothetical protein